MNRNFAEVEFDYIAWSDRTFRITFRRVPELLSASIREVGILNPLIVAEGETPDRYRIVTGWLRFQAARETNKNSVPCHIYENFPNKIMLLCGFFDNIGHRQMNPVEQGIALRKLGEYYTRDEVIRNFLPMLGHRAHINIWERIVPYADLPEEYQWAIADGILNDQAALTLMRLPANSHETVFRLMKRLRMSASIQREVAEMFREIWERDDTFPEDVIKEEGLSALLEPKPVQLQPTNIADLEAEIADVLQNPDLALAQGNFLAPGNKAIPLNSRRKPRLEAQYDRAPAGENKDLDAEAVRQRIRRRRFPHLKAMEDNYANQVKELHLPPEARLTPTPYFESTAQKLEVRFNSPDHLRGILERLLNAEERGLMKKVFESLRS